jgi:hypothetical protein
MADMLGAAVGGLMSNPETLQNMMGMAGMFAQQFASATSAPPPSGTTSGAETQGRRVASDSGGGDGLAELLSMAGSLMQGFAQTRAPPSSARLDADDTDGPRFEPVD